MEAAVANQRYDTSQGGLKNEIWMIQVMHRSRCHDRQKLTCPPTASSPTLVHEREGRITVNLLEVNSTVRLPTRAYRYSEDDGPHCGTDGFASR